MLARWFFRIDVMVRLLLAATVLAVLIPASGAMQDVARSAANIAIFALFLLNGLRIDRREIVRSAANARFLLPLAVWIFGGMTLAGWGIATLGEAWMSPLIALGFLFLGTLPSTVQSATSYTMLARGNVALSVVGAALINIVGVFVSAPVFALIAGSAQAELGNEVILRIGVILVLPFAIGQAVQGLTREWIERHRADAVWVDRLVIAFIVYVAFSAAVEQGIWDRVDLTTWIAMLAGIAAMLVIGNAGAWSVAGLLRLPLPDKIAFLFAGSQKSAAIGVPLGAILFPVEVAGFVLLPLLLYHLVQLVVAAPLASRLAARPD